MTNPKPTPLTTVPIAAARVATSAPSRAAAISAPDAMVTARALRLSPEGGKCLAGSGDPGQHLRAL